MKDRLAVNPGSNSRNKTKTNVGITVEEQNLNAITIDHMTMM